jgi:hypothetical protein
MKYVIVALFLSNMLIMNQALIASTSSSKGLRRASDSSSGLSKLTSAKIRLRKEFPHTHHFINETGRMGEATAEYIGALRKSMQNNLLILLAEPTSVAEMASYESNYREESMPYLVFSNTIAVHLSKIDREFNAARLKEIERSLKPSNTHCVIQ